MIRTTTSLAALALAAAVFSSPASAQSAAPSADPRAAACEARAYHVWRPALEAGQVSEAGRASRNGRRASCQLDARAVRAAIAAGTIRHPGAATTATAPQSTR